MPETPRYAAHPRVSVIMPAYNAADTIERAIASVQGQTLQDVEIIVADDASSDGTAEIVARLAAADARIVLVRLAENAGPGAARNRAIAEARGDWIAPLDADDAYLPQRLETLVQYGERLESDWIADNLLLCASDGTGEGNLAFPPDRLTAASPLSAQAFVENDMPRTPERGFGYLKPVIRRSFLERTGAGYPEDLMCGEDWCFYLACLLAAARADLLPEAYYRYTQTAQSLSRAPAQFETNMAQLSEGNRRMKQAAARLGESGAVAALRRRQAHIDATRWIDRLGAAVRSRNILRGLGVLVTPPLVPVTLYHELGWRFARWRRSML